MDTMMTYRLLEAAARSAAASRDAASHGFDPEARVLRASASEVIELAHAAEYAPGSLLYT